MAIHNYAYENESKSDARRNAEKAKKSGYVLNSRESHIVGCIVKVCSECKKRIPQGEGMIIERSGSIRCVPCDKLRKNCVICGSVFYSRVNNKVTCDNITSRCSYEYQKQRARERYHEMSARALRSY